MPLAVARERERFGAYRERTGGSGLLSDVLVAEVRKQERLVAIDDEAALICPWASRSPFELRVVPRVESARFEDDTAGAAMLRTALRALGEMFGGPPELNMWVRTAPRGAEHFHWHIDIVPRLTVRASFELATGSTSTSTRPSGRRPTSARRSANWANRVLQMPPTPRPIPSFIADSTQEGIPHGRFVERLAEPFREGLRPRSRNCPTGSRPPDKLLWFPERAWGGRTWVPCTARTDGPGGRARAVRPRLLRAPRGGRADRLPGRAPTSPT